MQPFFTPESAPLEVDRVEWVPASPEAVHVHVFGRWKDRPAAEPLVLLVGSELRRHAFDALTSAPAGVLAAFAVPNELRARLGFDLMLQIGSHELALPPAGTGTVRAEGAPAIEEAPQAEIIDRAVLAERRARRAELAEESLQRRATDAEKAVGTLEAQLANLEERLSQARDERDELQAALSDAERRARTAQQREYAEQQGRIEAQDAIEEVKRNAEHEVADLRRRLEAADERAEEMAREVDRARRGIAEALQRSEADRVALRRAEEQLAARNEGTHESARGFEERAELERSLTEVSGLAGELREALATEKDARARAEAALTAEREEASTRVTRLEQELESREAAQSRIVEQLQELRSELEAARSEASMHEGTARSVGHLSEIADRLKDRVVALERRKEAVEAELTQTQDVLRQRTEELERAKIDLEHATRDVELVRAESERHRAALEQANRTIEAVRQSAGELQLRLDEERRERAEAEAALHEQLSRAQTEGRQSAVQIEVELRAAIEAERRAVAEQVASIEAHVAGLRDQVVIAAAQLRDELDTERAARQAAERQLAEQRERVAEERDRVAGERGASADALAQLALEKARREELEQQIADALSVVRDVRAEDEAREARDAAVQRLVAEVLGTAASLREAFEAESRKLEGELTAVVVEERRRMADELAAMVSRAGELMHELAGAGEDLRSELEAERQARWLAEAELARERQRGAARTAGVAEGARPVSEPPATPGAPARAAGADAAETPPASSEAQTIIADLAGAAERLRSETPPVEEAEVDAEPAVEVEAEPVAAMEAGPMAAMETEPVVDVEFQVEAPAAVEDGPQILEPRLISTQRPTTPWLPRAIQRLAAADPATAAQLVVGLLPVQRLRVSGETTYDLTVTELGTFRVVHRLGATSVEPRSEPGGRKDVDFHLEGPAAALAEFAAGGASRRPANTHFEGRRRKLRRMLKDLRDPLHLPDIARSGAIIEPGLVLAALTAGIEPALAEGHEFTVAWDVTGPHGGRWTVRVGDGLPRVEPGLPEGGPTATVHVAQSTFLPLLACFAPPPGEQATVTGNAPTVALLRQWFDRAQGLS